MWLVGGKLSGAKLTFQMHLSSFLAIPWLGVERDLPSRSVTGTRRPEGWWQ